MADTIVNTLENISLGGNTTAKTFVDAVGETGPGTWYTLLGLVTLSLLSFRVRESHDLHKNNSGFFQFSGLFYRVQPTGFHWISAVPYLMNFVPTLAVFLGTYLGGYWTWFTALAGYVIVPLGDLVVGEDSYNPTKEEEKYLRNNIWFRVLTWLYPPLYVFSVLAGAYHIHLNPDLTNAEIAGITVSTAIAGGFGIGCIHELVHRPTKFELGLARFSLIFANYGHFWIEHIWGHHKRVATDEDPASSALGDDLYTFLIRCWIGVASSAWDIERRFLAKEGKSTFSPSNRVIQAWVASSIVGLSILHYLGVAAFVFYIGQGIGVWMHIDNANYIEHYGLRRRSTGKIDKDGEKEYERPGWFHAWNTADRLSNYILFKIERHPDHHTNAGRPYQILRHFKESPTMPTGYAGMFVLSWFPPLWWMVMDPLVQNAKNAMAEYESQPPEKRNYEFPKGFNNMSSAFKREGEGFFEAGSSPYEKGFYGSDASAPKKVWGDEFDQKQIEQVLTKETKKAQ